MAFSEIVLVSELLLVAREDNKFKAYLIEALGDRWDRDQSRRVSVDYSSDSRDFTEANITWF